MILSQIEKLKAALIEVMVDRDARALLNTSQYYELNDMIAGLVDGPICNLRVALEARENEEESGEPERLTMKDVI